MCLDVERPLIMAVRSASPVELFKFALRSFLLRVISMCGIHISLVMIGLFVALDGRAT